MRAKPVNARNDNEPFAAHWIVFVEFIALILLLPSISSAQPGTVLFHQKISELEGGFAGTLDNNDIFGNALSSIGDLDGDGVTDLAVGATLDDDGGTNRGAVWALLLDGAGKGAAGSAAATTAEIRAVGAAMAAWLADQVGGGPPPDAFYCVWNGSFDVSTLDVITRADLEALLVPDYIDEVPAQDTWGNPYEFRLSNNLLLSNVMSIRSMGADGTFEGNSYAGGYTSGPNEDIVWANRLFVRQAPRLDPVSRQRRSVEEETFVGRAMLAWLIDQTGGPPPAGGGPAIDLIDYTQISHAEWVNSLAPSINFFYTQCIPELDSWGNPYEYYRNANLLGSQVIAIRSAGADGLVEGDVYNVGTFPADDFDRDIVWADGTFVQRPEGEHALIFSDSFEHGLWGTWQ